MTKIHLDTDIGGDMDDLCALAMLFVAIGPSTNLMLLEKTYPGILKQTDLFLMGGHVFAIPAGYPQWSKEEDYNIQVDIHSARYVLDHAYPTLVPVTVTCQTALRRAYLPRLARAGPLGELIVLQSEFACLKRGKRTSVPPTVSKSDSGFGHKMPIEATKLT